MTRAALFLFLAACAPRLPGAPEPGRSCSNEAPECATAEVVSVCESGSWVEYPCPSRCSNSQAPRCDWGKAKVGDACPVSFEGDGTISSGGVACAEDGQVMIGCNGGVFVAVRCPNCQHRGAGFICG